MYPILLPTYATPLRLDIGSSRTYSIFVITAVTVAMLCLSVLSINVGLKLLLACALCLISFYSYFKNNVIKIIVWKQNNQWEIIDDQACHALLLPNSLVLPWLTILNFKLDTGRCRSIILLSDNLDKESFRKLRVRLKVSSGTLFKTDKPE